MRSIYILITTLIVAILSTSCEKELDFDYHRIDPIAVIEGSLTDREARVAVTFTTPMDEPFADKHVTDATVSLIDHSSGLTYALEPGDNETFHLTEGGVTGHTYSIDVQTADKRYTSLKSTMLLPVEITAAEFQWIEMPFDDMAIIALSFTDINPDYGDSYWIRLYRNGKAYSWTVTNDLFSKDGSIDIVITTTRRDLDEEEENQKIEKGDEVTVSVTPVERAILDYLVALQIGNSNGPAMFEGDRCLGYFLASPVAAETLIFDPDTMPVAGS